ncbi:zinc finger protein 567-like [Branchiostoma floridae]|uniref:Zinc finger protein 567-like n=1 Tax=Branchiostoma floridae TaxID=7739 RepID=A0A9J7HDI3_BRAFL|nr:zinc finger protein 567-like [Branchiostoma floridae]
MDSPERLGKESDYNEHLGKETDIRKTQTTDMDLQPVKCYVNFPQPDNISTSQVQESEGDMGRHVVKDASGEKPYMCEVCGSRTPRKCNLSLHTRTDTDELFDGFDQNDYSAAQNSHLNNHSVTKRTGDKPYMCGECGYRTDYHSHLSNHMRTHTGEKPYKCHQCDYSARQQSALDNHLKRHTGEKPYICRECGYRTITKTNLLRHMRKHTGEKPHACDFCNYSTADKGTLERHITAKHADKKPYMCDEWVQDS